MGDEKKFIVIIACNCVYLYVTTYMHTYFLQELGIKVHYVHY